MAMHHSAARNPCNIRWPLIRGVGNFWFSSLACALCADDVADGLHDMLGNLFLFALGCQLFHGLCPRGHACAVHTPEKVFHFFIIMSTARALVDIGDVVTHVSDWEPAIHSFGSKHSFRLSLLAPNRSHRWPAHQIKDLVVPFIFLEFLYTVGPEGRLVSCAVYFRLVVRGNPSGADA